MKLSIVTTLYNSSQYVDEFHRRITEAANLITNDYEIIFVNDGSPDASLIQAIAVHERDPHVKVIDLSRNFGHHKAMMTGLAQSRGEHVFLIDSDLEEEPESLPEFWEKLQDEMCDVVFGVQQARRGGFFEQLSGNLFYWMARNLTDIELPRNMSTIRLMTRRYVESLVLHQEHEVVIAGLWMVTGYRQVPLTINKKRQRKSNYGFFRKVNIATDFLTAFSGKLLYLVFYLGLVISLVAFSYTGYLVANYFIRGTGISGWTSTIVSIWLLGGLLILFVGLIGIFVARIFSETKNRPYTLIRQVYQKKPENDPPAGNQQ